MRVLSSPKVVESGEQIGRKIVDTYLEPDKTFLELREMVNSGSIDLLRDFSEACRAELELAMRGAAPDALTPTTGVPLPTSFWPALARMPSAPFAQPAASSIELALATSCGYLGLASLLKAQETGGIEVSATAANLK